MMRRQLLLPVGLTVFALVLYSLSPTASYSTYIPFSAQDSCPNPLVPHSPTAPVRRPVCSFLDTHPDLTPQQALKVELCMSSAVPNHGWIRIERTDKSACAASESIRTANDPQTDAILKSKGPDFFNIRMDGEQRWGMETEVEYLGSCNYKYPFRLVTAAPFNLTVRWVFENYRAALESQELALQYDLARPILADTHIIVASPSSARCPPIVAAPTKRQWRTPALDAYTESLPECSAFTPTPGHYLRPHHSEDPAQFWQRYIYQPAGCRWSNYIPFGAPVYEITKGFQKRKIFIMGDSHARYAYDLLVDAYMGDWDLFMKAPGLKQYMKNETIGPMKLDFFWEPVLAEVRVQVNCSLLAQYDTVLLSAGQHNAVQIPADKEHPAQMTLNNWRNLIASFARRLHPDACPGQPMPKVIWMGNPSRMPRLKPADKSAWLDGRSSFRVRLYDDIAWSVLEKIPGAARVDMFGLSQPFAGDYRDGLHMRGSEALATLIQEMHEKIRPTERAYAHLPAPQ